MTKILPVIMCGGSGTRVWPESRESLPKQFIPLIGETSTFQNILKIIADDTVFEPPIVITNLDYRFRAAEQVSAMNLSATIVLEPMRKDSAAAVAVAVELAAARSPDTIVAVLAADHVIGDPAAFVRLCGEAAQAARNGEIVTFGVTPTHPATGYGYIRPGASVTQGLAVRKIEAFVEKPNAEVAADYVKQGYLWNSGNFIFRASAMQRELENFVPEILSAAHEAVKLAKQDLQFLVLDKDAFAKSPKTSIDYAVMEKTKHAAVIPADMGWSDVGSWTSVWELSDRDDDGNSVRGRGVVMGSKNVHVRSDEILTAVVGMEDVIVVTSADAVLVLHQSQADKVKQLVDELKARGHKEAVEHRRMYRPWGYYQSIDNGARYQVKRIVVKAGGALSLQKHFHRAEHWIVVKGIAEVTRNEEVILVHENESIYLPIGCTHRMINPGKIDLELIEVQVGSYLGEDDIIRIEDVYNRA